MLNHQIYSQINQFNLNYPGHSNQQQNCLPTQYQYIQQSTTKKKSNQFRIQIRNNQLKDYKEKIRQQMLKTSIIERLLEQMPYDSQSATSWAHELLKAYGKSLQYKLTIDRAVDLFKLVEKFPNKCTLQLFELVVMRANKDSIDMLFQYDVMRLLHSFINFTGKDRKIRSPKSSNSFQEIEIVKQVVISDQVVQQMEKNYRKKYTDYDQKIQITKCVLRIIGQLCRKDQRVRNFAVINHKTYTYCLKAYMFYQKSVQIEFFFFLEAATFQCYNSKGGDEQLNRLTIKIIRLFFSQKIDVKVELLDEGRSSHFYRYQLLMKAMKNILNMKSQWINSHILDPQDEQGDPLIASSLLSLLRQCNYVISFPAVKGVEDRLLPGKLLSSLIELIMLVIELLDIEQKYFSKFPYLYQEIIVLLSQAKIGLGDINFTIARRGCYFLISNIFCQQLNPQIFKNFIFYSDQNPKSNVVSLLRFLLEIESNYENKQEISVIFLKLFENGYPHIIQPLLLQNDILSLFFEIILLGNTNYTQNSLVFCQQIVKINVIQTIATFFSKMGSLIGQKILYYRQIVLSQYEQRLSALMMSDQCSQNFYRYAYAMLSIIKNCSSS